jgi:zona occludens toxin
MPINAFGGGPGSGKTYGVVEHVILPAVAAGRFVLTNIDGLNTDLIYEYVLKHFYKDKIICLGHIRMCGRNRPGEDGFFPGDAQLDKPCPCPPPTLDVVAGGDLVVIDEATRYWPQGEKVSKESAFFFREHRHFSNEIGQTCDLVVIDPDLMLLARPLRGKIELSSLTHKPKAIGMNRYVVRLFRGCKLTGKPQSINGPYKFQPEIFALYKSYSHENAKETAIDGRQNLFKSKAFWSFAGGVALISSIGVWGAWRFFHPDSAVAPGAVAVVQPNPFVPAVAPGAVPVPGQVQPPVVSEVWRVVGSMSAGGNQWVVLSDAAGRLRVESPSVFIGNGAASVGEVDGSRVTPWSGRSMEKGGVK